MGIYRDRRSGPMQSSTASAFRDPERLADRVQHSTLNLYDDTTAVRVSTPDLEVPPYSL